jgi:protoporphyrinogen oxidase
MRYPTHGGYRAFFEPLAREAHIQYHTHVTSIDPSLRQVKDIEGRTYKYKRLITSPPLSELARIVKGAPESVLRAADKLECTCGYHISVALKTKRIPPYLWWYVYDEDILTARVHSPSLKSPDNAPEGCSSLQMEVYCKEGQYTEQQLLDGTVGKLVKLGIIHEEDILFTHIGFERYANIIFTEPIYDARKIVRDYLSSVGIETIGRFGEWDYLWSDQALMSGLKV